MKKLFRALSLCLTLALCVSGSTAALAEAPAAGQPYTPENLRNDILAKYGDLAAYNPQVPYDYIVYYGTSLTPSKEFA